LTETQKRGQHGKKFGGAFRYSFAGEEIQGYLSNPGKPKPLLPKRLQDCREKIPEICPERGKDLKGRHGYFL
jgi:hypothetical protein